MWFYNHEHNNEKLDNQRVPPTSHMHKSRKRYFDRLSMTSAFVINNWKAKLKSRYTK